MKADNPFDLLSQDPVYLQLKNHLYNFLIRREKIREDLKPELMEGRILEIGVAVSPILENQSNVFYSDLSCEAMKYLKAKNHSVNLLATSAEAISIKSESMTAVVCSEVLEHIPDDQKALREIRRILRPGGRLILTVPLHPQLFAYDDRFVNHYRRYVLKDLLAQLEKLGFGGLKVVKLTGMLEKITMLAAVPIFQALKTGDRHFFRRHFDERSEEKSEISRLRLEMTRTHLSPILKILFPFYKFLNRIYARIVTWEAAIVPLALCTSVMVAGRKTPSG